MARSTSLSDDAFLALRREKQAGESDSDVVLRLVSEARARRHDPARFLRTPVSFAFDEAEYEAILQRMRDADRAPAGGG